ncbi:hypothetical protein GQ53DRAFT_181094 [Thozetella sp. PMI_491]|nr:hypothetical protein GQ53DRAFT_181094 [Thozetella sp. PMI_491]
MIGHPRDGFATVRDASPLLFSPARPPLSWGFETSTGAPGGHWPTGLLRRGRLMLRRSVGRGSLSDHPGTAIIAEVETPWEPTGQFLGCTAETRIARQTTTVGLRHGRSLLEIACLCDDCHPRSLLEARAVGGHGDWSASVPVAFREAREETRPTSEASELQDLPCLPTARRHSP